MKLKAAVVGCGRIGFGFDEDPRRKYIATHSGAYSTCVGTKLVAICDPDKNLREKCMKKWKVSSSYSDISEMIRNEDIDILSVCTPPGTHYSVIKEVVKSETIKAVFCEKPLAGSKKDAKKIPAIKLNDKQRKTLDLRISLL